MFECRAWDDAQENHVLAPAHYSWDDANTAPLADPAASESDSDLDEPVPRPQEEFLNFHIALLLPRVINAKQFCICMHWAAESGLDFCRQRAMAPGKPSGHYARKLKTTLPVLASRPRTYQLQVPGRHKRSSGRTTHVLTVIPPH